MIAERLRTTCLSAKLISAGHQDHAKSSYPRADTIRKNMSRTQPFDENIFPGKGSVFHDAVTVSFASARSTRNASLGHLDGLGVLTGPL